MRLNYYETEEYKLIVNIQKRKPYHLTVLFPYGTTEKVNT